jgi:hypothetical protein
MKFSPRSTALFLAFAVMGTTLPLAAAETLQGVTLGTYTTSDGTVVQMHKAFSFRDRYDFNRATRIYSIYLQQGKTGLVKPDINDRSTIDVYINNPLPVDDFNVNTLGVKPVSTTDYVPKPVETNWNDLNDLERSTMSAYIKIGKCWLQPTFTKGFYELCTQMIRGKKVINTAGFGNDIQNTRASARSSLSAAISSKAALFDGVVNNRTGGRTTPYGRGGGRASASSSSSSSSTSSK